MISPIYAFFLLITTLISTLLSVYMYHHSSETRTILVQRHIGLDQNVGCSMPFSWRIRDYLDELWVHALQHEGIWPKCHKSHLRLRSNKVNHLTQKYWLNIIISLQASIGTMSRGRRAVCYFLISRLLNSRFWLINELSSVIEQQSGLRMQSIIY